MSTDQSVPVTPAISEAMVEGRQSLGLDFARRAISRSIASRMRSRRGSDGFRTASMRAVVPAASGNLNCSDHSFFLPTLRGISGT